MAETIKYGNHINSLTISRKADRSYVSFSMNVEVCSLLSKSQARCGVDLGIKSLATISQGGIREWKAPKPSQEVVRTLAQYQRRLVKKVKGSAGYRILKTRIAQFHKRIADIRANAVHQLISYLFTFTHFFEVVIEDLNIKGIMANGKLARHVADVGLHEFRCKMTYKMDWRGGVPTIADRWYSSRKLCSGCGSRKPDLTLAERTYHCEACGHKECLDFNASKNLEKSSTARSAGIDAAASALTA